MYSSRLLVGETVPLCDELRSLVADADPNAKDDILSQAAVDPGYGDAVRANELIFKFRRLLGERILQHGGLIAASAREVLDLPGEADASYLITSGDLIIDFGANYPFSAL